MPQIPGRRAGHALSSSIPPWTNDPLAHPDIEEMDLRMLGDLPFGLFNTAASCGDERPALRDTAGNVCRTG
ncbi:hypothetical protein F3Y30_08825 [Sinorhizobium sp. BG8]|nr:hypothetical protein F3Y30_08825 [Sinorhizobium sp. BG8]